MSKRTCSVDGCDNKHEAKGWCKVHYHRHRRHGDPLGGIFVGATPEEAFAHRTKKVGDHLIWTGGTVEDGYGRILVKSRKMLVHRWIYERKVGPIPDGMFVDHICGIPACCNVDHLRVVTRKQNMEHRVRLPKSNTSGYRGVHWVAARGKWRAVVFHNRKPNHAGYFDTAEAANEAAIALRNKLFTHNDRDRAG